MDLPGDNSVNGKDLIEETYYEFKDDSARR